MTPEQIVKVAAMYKKELTNGHIARVYGAVECNHNYTGLPIIDQLQHCLWMLEQIPEMVTEKPDKAMRWLCFVQGVLWAHGYKTITEMRDDNR